MKKFLYALLYLVLVSTQLFAWFPAEETWRLELEASLIGPLWVDENGGVNLAIGVGNLVYVLRDGEVSWRSDTLARTVTSIVVISATDEESLVLAVGSSNWGDATADYYFYSDEDFSTIETVSFEGRNRDDFDQPLIKPDYSFALIDYIPDEDPNVRGELFLGATHYEPQFFFPFGYASATYGTYYRYDLENQEQSLVLGTRRFSGSPMQSVRMNIDEDAEDELVVVSQVGFYGVNGGTIGQIDLFETRMNLLYFDNNQSFIGSETVRTLARGDWFIREKLPWGGSCVVNADEDEMLELVCAYEDWISAEDYLLIFDIESGSIIDSLDLELEFEGDDYVTGVFAAEDENGYVLIFTHQGEVIVYDPTVNEIVLRDTETLPEINTVKMLNIYEDAELELILTSGSELIVYDVGQLDVDEQVSNPETPKEFEIYGVYPNPFNSTTTISYTLQTLSNIAIQIYNTRGQLVDVLVDGVMPAGRNRVFWDAGEFPAGVYLISIKDEGRRMNWIRKVVSVR